jgi:protein involved in polysaccharide export with SLBB domain
MLLNTLRTSRATDADAAPQSDSKRKAPAASQGERGGRTKSRAPDSSSSAASRKVQPGLNAHPDYVIEPPDTIVVEVLEALPGRPISGERLVRPDGKISLGFYGEVYVAGLTVLEAKEKIVAHMRICEGRIARLVR